MTLGRMQRCWCRQNDAIRLDSSDQVFKLVEMRDRIGITLISAVSTWIGNSTQFDTVNLADRLGMTTSHQSQTGNGDAQRQGCLALAV